MKIKKLTKYIVLTPVVLIGIGFLGVKANGYITALSGASEVNKFYERGISVEGMSEFRALASDMGSIAYWHPGDQGWWQKSDEIQQYLKGCGSCEMSVYGSRDEYMVSGRPFVYALDNVDTVRVIYKSGYLDEIKKIYLVSPSAEILAEK